MSSTLMLLTSKLLVILQDIYLLLQYMFRNTCRGLFENHKLLFSFHMCIKILNAQGKIFYHEYNFLLRGGVVLDREDQMDNPCSSKIDI